jgi:CheY-like chemotaxis protein
MPIYEEERKIRPPMNTTPRLAGSQVPILMVDDDPAKRVALKAVLRPLGYSIVEAESGLDALRCVMNQEFAVILLDVMMPLMGGFETAELIRHRQASETTPIIFITAHGEDEIVNLDLYAQGAVDFIFAPVAPHELRAKVSVFANLFIKAEKLAARARAVETSADQLRLLTDAAPVGIFHTDADSRYVYTNARWTEITGIPAEQAAGQRWDIIMGSEEPAGPIPESPGGAAGSVELSHRLEIAIPGSGPRTVLVTSKSVPDGDGGIAGWAGTIVDVTAEPMAEAAMSGTHG